MRAKYPLLDGYADAGGNGRTNLRMSPNDYNQYESTPAFGAYQRDSQAAEQLRDFYDTVDAVASRALVAEGNNVQRVANISEREIQLMAESKEVERSKKWEQYWWSTADPSKPWTMTELNKIDPAMVQRKFDAIQEVSQFALDKAIIKHLGHSGDPHLAQLQYIMDQGQMDHMPQTVLVDKAPYQRGPLSVFALGAADDKSRFSQSVILPRQSFQPKVSEASASRINRTGPPSAAYNQLAHFERTAYSAPYRYQVELYDQEQARLAAGGAAAT
ncbi:hypothetical protein T492DRAFT_840885 [Pavlovales sp. CCMP2436]|nr:hypothetical protein T492DRAFT_840885 [Pavlovales sp. CCMP2436]